MGSFKDITDSLTLSPQAVLRVTDKFTEALSNRPADYGLKLLDSTFGRPTGNERGEVLVVDFGGTNLRLLLVDLKGHRAYEVLNQRVINLRQNRTGLDLTSDSAQADQMFGYIAAEIEDFIGIDRDYRLGHSFSFPARHLNRNSAILLEWTKEIRTKSVVGQDVNLLLQQALQRRGMANIQTKAIINDAVGTLLAGAYQNLEADVGSICGTGHNSCFVDEEGRLINTESGNFFDEVLPVTKFDRQLDDSSLHPRAQRLEKMVAGAYLGELYRLILLDLAENTDSFDQSIRLAKVFPARNSIDSADISALLQDRTFTADGKEYGLSTSDFQIVEEIARLLVVRSAQLIAATYLGIINHIDRDHQRRHIITIDGSLYEKMPYFAKTIQDTLHVIYPAHHHLIQLRFSKDASGIGAAVAAAMAK